MKPGSEPRNWIGAWMVISLVAMIAACGVISPRRIVSNNPSPTGTPTPVISPTPTVTPTPTPTGMAAVVPKQFLFITNPDAGLILGFEVNGDGGLSPVPGSPFVASDSPDLVAATGSNLLVAGKSTLAAFTVDKQTGAIRETDSVAVHAISSFIAQPSPETVLANTAGGTLAIRVVNSKLQITSASGATPATAESESLLSRKVKDVTGKFVFVLDPSAGSITTLSTQDDKALARSLSAGHGASAITISVP